MSANKWTPGPWAIMDEADPDLTVMGQATDCEMICHIPDVDFDSDAGTPHPVNVANARLIAAAPDLVEALVWCVEIIQGHADEHDLTRGHPYGPVLDAAKVALTKAGAA